MSNQTVHDPVCHMDITPESAFGSSEYEGQMYYFCGRGCKLDFDEDPAGVLAAEAEYDHSQPVEEMMAPPATIPSNAPASGEPKKPWWRFW